jgi:hypothetical protein
MEIDKIITLEELENSIKDFNTASTEKPMVIGRRCLEKGFVVNSTDDLIWDLCDNPECSCKDFKIKL